MRDVKALRSLLGGPVFKADLRRTPLRRVSKKKAAANRVLAVARKAVRKRADGRCEACRVHYLLYCTTFGAHAHHIVRRSQGGPDTPTNLLWVSPEHHDWIHAHPAAAESLGLLRRQVVVPFRGDAA